MNYLALGDSISIDDYTGVIGGGAANQFARLLKAEHVQNLTRDGCTTSGVLEALRRVNRTPDLVTLTVGGNDFLESATAFGHNISLAPAMDEWINRRIFGNIEKITATLSEFCCPVIINTIYDPTDGDDALAAALGVPPWLRSSYNMINTGIRSLALEHHYILCDLQELFTGHGLRSSDSWITMEIEPNHAGATAIAKRWHELYQQSLQHPAMRADFS